MTDDPEPSSMDAGQRRAFNERNIVEFRRAGGRIASFFALVATRTSLLVP